MSNEKKYRVYELCEALGISFYTLSNWYRYQSKRLEAGEVTEKYLPEPIRLEDIKGKPRIWTETMLEELREYQKNIVTGRNGIYGKYSNPLYYNTKKYKKTIEGEK